MLNKAANYTQIIKFGVAGAIGALIEIGLFILLVDIIEMYYLTANLIAISVAILVNYLISQKWVFEGGRYRRGVEFTIFVLVSLIALMLNQLLMWLLVERAALDTTLSKVLAIGLVAGYNFIAKKFFVFKG